MRLRLLPLALVSTLLPLGCADEVDNVEPYSGTWNYDESSPVNNTCPSDFLYTDPSSTKLLDYDGGSSFDVEEGETDLHCNISGDDFTCPDRVLSSETDEGLNVTFEVHVRVEGTFLSPTEAEGSHYMSVECQGDGCGAFTDVIPCAYQRPFVAEAQQS